MMGTNPDIVLDGPRKDLQVLADEENIARELAKSLSAAQRAKAIFSDKAPADILTENKRKISPLEPLGINWKELNGDQMEMVWKLVKAYVQRARGEIADTDLKKITDAGQDKIHFAWAGAARTAGWGITIASKGRLFWSSMTTRRTTPTTSTPCIATSPRISAKTC